MFLCVLLFVKKLNNECASRSLSPKVDVFSKVDDLFVLLDETRTAGQK